MQNAEEVLVGQTAIPYTVLSGNLVILTPVRGPWVCHDEKENEEESDSVS